MITQRRKVLSRQSQKIKNIWSTPLLGTFRSVLFVRPRTSTPIPKLNILCLYLSQLLYRIQTFIHGSAESEGLQHDESYDSGEEEWNDVVMTKCTPTVLATSNRSQKRPVTHFATMIVLPYDFARASTSYTASPHAKQRRNLRCIFLEICSTVTRHPISKTNDGYWASKEGHRPKNVVVSDEILVLVTGRPEPLFQALACKIAIRKEYETRNFFFKSTIYYTGRGCRPWQVQSTYLNKRIEGRRKKKRRKKKNK